ncbi:unnamed protein product [Camellia sinensis]
MRASHSRILSLSLHFDLDLVRPNPCAFIKVLELLKTSISIRIEIDFATFGVTTFLVHLLLSAPKLECISTGFSFTLYGTSFSGTCAMPPPRS